MAYRAIQQSEIEPFAALQGRSFRFDATRHAAGLQEGTGRYRFDAGRVWEDEQRGLVAAMSLFPGRMALGGRALEAGLVSLVAVPPEERRRGYAGRLMLSGLREMHAQGVPLSLLFPYSIPFYNRFGYGLCSPIWLQEFALAEMADFSEGSRVRRMRREDQGGMETLYGRLWPDRNGWLERNEWVWRERVFGDSARQEWPKRVEGIVVPGESTEIEGYLTYTLAAENEETPASLTIREWVSQDDAAWRALAGFVAAQRAQAVFVRYAGPVGFPLHHAMRERNAYRNLRRREFAYRDTISQGAGLMVRLIHFDAALQQRPYPPTVSGRLRLQMRDPHLPENEIPLDLHLKAGGAQVERAAGEGATEAVAGSRTWAELYAGTLRPADARLLGRLEATDRAVTLLSAAFEGDPWYIHQADWF